MKFSSWCLSLLLLAVSAGCSWPPRSAGLPATPAPQAAEEAAQSGSILPGAGGDIAPPRISPPAVSVPRVGGAGGGVGRILR